MTHGVRPPDAAQSWFIRALAFGTTHQLESARDALAKGDELLRQYDRNVRTDFLWDWAEWAVAESLALEAKALLEGQTNSLTIPQPK